MSRPLLVMAFYLGAVAVAVGCGEPRAPEVDRVDAAWLGELERVLHDPDPFERPARLATWLGSQGAAPVVHFPSVLRDLRFDARGSEYALLVRYWASHEPERAALWALTLSPRGLRAGAIEEAWEAWARIAPSAAAEALTGSGARDPERADAERALLRGWPERQPGLEEFIREAGVGVERQRMLAQYAFALIRRHGPEAAVAFAASVPAEDGSYRLDVLRQTGLALATRHGEIAAAWCDRVCGEGDGVRGLVAQRWALADGRAAMAWATTRAPREIDRVVTSALRGWIRSDPGGLSEWMEERVRAEGPRPAWLDGLLSAYAGLLAGGEPELALHWAGEIEDRDAREQSQLAVFGHWQKRDEEAAEAWIEGSSLSEVARARAREPASAAPRRPRRRPGP